MDVSKKSTIPGINQELEYSDLEYHVEHSGYILWYILGIFWYFLSEQ